MKLSHAFLAIVLHTISPCVKAAIVYSGEQNVPIVFSPMDEVYVNVLTNDASVSEPGDFDSQPWLAADISGTGIFNGNSLQPVVLPIAVGEGRVLNLAAGTSVDAGSVFGTGPNYSDTHTGTGTNFFQPGTPGFIGFSFNQLPAGPTHYGWIKITVGENGGAGTIHEWAYENTPGASISVGAVPEPSFLLGLLTVAGCFALRRGR